MDERVRQDFARRFGERVAVGEPDACWVFGDREDYGSIALPDGTSERGHRAAWLLAYGPIPEGLWVLHKCDNPPCVNPAHLFLGTHQDNMDDMRRKGRAKGRPPVYPISTALRDGHAQYKRERVAGRVSAEARAAEAAYKRAVRATQAASCRDCGGRIRTPGAARCRSCATKYQHESGVF